MTTQEFEIVDYFNRFVDSSLYGFAQFVDFAYFGYESDEASDFDDFVLYSYLDAEDVEHLPVEPDYIFEVNGSQVQVWNMGNLS